MLNHLPNPMSSEYCATFLQRNQESQDSLSNGSYKYLITEKERLTVFPKRDSDESAPAEFPPEQPEADHADDDADRYGAEEIELEDALLKEDAALEAQEEAEASANPDAMHEDNDDESDAGSEDLEAESSDDDDEEEEEAEGEEEGDGDIEMGDGDEEAKPVQEEHAAGHEVMVH